MLKKLSGAHSLFVFPLFFPPFRQILIPLSHRLHRELHQFCSSSCDLSLQKPKKGKKKVIFIFIFVDGLGSAPSPCCVGDLFMARYSGDVLWMKG
jgi:hypothetical protein